MQNETECKLKLRNYKKLCLWVEYADLLHHFWHLLHLIILIFQSLRQQHKKTPQPEETVKKLMLNQVLLFLSLTLGVI
jgi:hypothetical protein